MHKSCRKVGNRVTADYHRISCGVEYSSVKLENNLGICNCVVTKTKVTLFCNRAVKLLAPAFKNIVGGKVVFD